MNGTIDMGGSATDGSAVEDSTAAGGDGSAVVSAVGVHARVDLALDIPGDVAEKFLEDAGYEGVSLRDATDSQREDYGEVLDRVIGEHFHELLDHLQWDPEV